MAGTEEVKCSTSKRARRSSEERFRITLRGLHLLLTYRCDLECDHCFVWGSPWQKGTMTLKDIRRILKEAQELGSVEWIYFEGGEPFLYYPVLVSGVKKAARMGFHVGIVSDCYWATEVEDALKWLRPFEGLVQDFSISSDSYHESEGLERQTENARAAAKRLNIPGGVICIAQPEAQGVASSFGQLQPDKVAVMYRGRAAEKLVRRAPHLPWGNFTKCPHEDLREPGRLHVDPFGNLHVCQGISLGNVFSTSLKEMCETYDPDSHPIITALLRGGPAELARVYGVPHDEGYADACHFCYEARLALRERFPQILNPDQMYGGQGAE